MDNGQLTKTDKRIARPLSVISGLIKKERQQSLLDSESHWSNIALLLVEAFVHFDGHWGEFEAWFNGQGFDFGFQSAKAKLKALENLQKDRARFQKRELPSQRDARQPGYEWPEEEVREKVRKSVEMSRRILAEAAVKKDESDAIRKLALQIVDIGFKTLSAKLHPDRRGGSHDAMRRLNSARQLLKSYLG